MGVPASETFSGEYFDAIVERKAKATEKEQENGEEDTNQPNIIVGHIICLGFII
jgi:hypothetical protein